MALLSWLPPGVPRNVLVSMASMGVLPLISAGTLFWPLSAQKNLSSGPTRAVVTIGSRGPQVPGFGCGGGRLPIEVIFSILGLLQPPQATGLGGKVSVHTISAYVSELKPFA